ncbi:MAG: TRAP transporter large permease subunit [Deltaproteobacteria bacterium]|nr:TRAP transporter large permease subunit [Deltaproteobacteria bacterium]
MEWWVILLVFVGFLLLMLATGMPVAFSFFLINMVGAATVLGGEVGLRQMMLSIYSGLTSFTLAPVPLFVFMGEILFHSGMAIRTLDVLDKWMGRLPGRLSLLTVAGGTIFSNLSGSTMANTAMLGSLLVPGMQSRGYRKPMILGPILGTGGIAMIIPPSALAIVLGTLAHLSIGELLLAGILPGLLMAVLYFTYIIGRCKLDPSLAPAYEVEKVSLGEKLADLFKYVLPLTTIVFLVVGLIFLGVATPTEAAAMGSVGSIALAACYGAFNLGVLKRAVRGSLKVTVMTFMIIAGSITFSQILAFTGATRGMVEFVAGLPLDPILILICMQLILILLGAFMEQISMMMISVPIFMPVVHALGFDPIWFGILMLLNLEIAFTTPPFGLLLFVMKGVAPEDTTMGDIYRAALPFIVCDLIAMALIMAYPAITLWLPGLMR